jgi:hypothetical protein
MHADAMPDSDPATLAKPVEVAVRILNIIQHAEDFPNGATL